MPEALLLPIHRVDTLPRTERFENRQASARVTLKLASAPSHAQAACRFNAAGSKRTPFFQIVKTIAAILRANVKRAIVGFIPLASKFR